MDLSINIMNFVYNAAICYCIPYSNSSLAPHSLLAQLSLGFTNSTTMHVMLSAPKPSEAAKFIGQILSIINSIILDRFTCGAPPLEPDVADVLKLEPLIPGDPVDYYLFNPGDGYFLVGEVPVILFL